MEEFKTIPYQAKMRYLYNTLPQVGEGSSRNVFKLDNEFVIKMAKNEAGVDQNKAEATVCTIDKGLSLFAKVAEVGKDFVWLKSELAIPMTEEGFEKATGIPWNTFTDALRGAFPEKLKGGQAGESSKSALLSLRDNQWFKRVLNIIKGCKYEPGDIAKLDSWGIANGRAAIIDSGFTEAVMQAHYSPQAQQDLPQTKK